MKRLILLAAMVSLGVLTLTITPVSAAQDWTSSYLTVSDNSFVQGNHKNYSKEGTHRVIFSIDAWNSNICISNAASSKFLVMVNRSLAGLIYGQALVTTKVGTCVNQGLGKQPPGEYWYTFSTRVEPYACGFKSNKFVYGINPKF